MTAADFAALLDVARARGVSQFECDGVKVTFAYVDAPTTVKPSLPVAPPDDRYADPGEAARIVGAPPDSGSILEAKIRDLRAAEADMFPVIGGEP